MNPVDYFASLDEEQKKNFAKRADTSLEYLRLHVLRQKGGFRKRPGDDLIVRLVKASAGKISLDDAIDYFLAEPVRKLAAELKETSVFPAVEHKSGVQGKEVKGFDGKDLGRVGL